MTNLRYTKDHECLMIEAGGASVRIGITQYARDALGDLVFIELPAIGKKVTKGQSFAVVESVKTAADVYSPVDGAVTAVNGDIAGNLDLIKTPLSEQGWIAVIAISDPAQIDGMMDEPAYEAYLKTL